MEISKFEGVKVALKQDRTGYILTLSVHPDEVPEEILRDFVGARYQVVMVRLTNEERPMVREQEHSGDMVRMAGILCRDPMFQRFLLEAGQTFDASEDIATAWLKEELNIQSRAELRENQAAASQLRIINQEFQAWKTTV
jgi:hypothetical protein